MRRDEPLVCWIVGDDPLVATCGALLIERGHVLRGVVTGAPGVASWAAEMGLAVLETLDEVALGAEPFDHLFAIGWHEPIPESILALAEGACVAYHDGLEPLGEGPGAAARVLFGSAPRHGVAWHAMTAEPLTGDILVREVFDLYTNDTTATVIERCDEYAERSFGRLVQGLAAGSLMPLPQSGRAHCGDATAPPPGCVIDWTAPAASIDAMVRALDFGAFDNPYGLAKLLVDGVPFVVLEAQAADAPPGEVWPGQIVSTRPVLTIGTGEGVLRILALATLDGVPLCSRDFVEQCGLSAGHSLDPFHEGSSERLAELEAAMAVAEPDWIERLSDLRPAEIPFVGAEFSQDEAPRRVERFRPPESLRLLYDDRMEDALAAAFGSCLARLQGVGLVDVGFSDPELRRRVAGFEAFCVDRAALRIRCDRPFEELIDEVAAARARLAETGGWLRDAVARYPSLPHRLREAGGLFFPVSVHVAFHNRALPECGESALALVIARDGCQLVYDPEVVSEETATAILREFEDLLMQIAAGEADVSPAGGIGADEREQVLFAWNDTQRESEPATRIHRRFEEQVDAEPSTRATIFRGDADSYGELETRANHIAQTLFDRGARPGHRIGVALPRDLDLAPSVLAVLKLGAAWAPLEARPTAASLNASIETLGLDQIVACGGEAQAGVEAAVLDLDADSDEIHSHTDERPQLDVAAEPLAAILPANDGRFVELSGANLEHLFDALDECIGTTHGTWLSLPQTSPATSALEQLWALTRGFEVIIADEPALPGSAAPAGQSLMLPGAGYAADDHSLAALLDRHRVSHFLCSEESLSDLVSDGGALRGLKEVRRILLLADTPAVSAEVRGAIASAEISVICGRRETSGVALHQPLPATSSFVPGGWPLPNTRAYVLGDDMGPQPVGIAGRLWIGGAGVALGYLNDPAAEAEAFADDPFRADGSRMFDTGLCARWLPEGRIELLRDDAAPTPAQPRREPARERPRRLADL